MTTRAAFARDIPSFGCGFAALGSLPLSQKLIEAPFETY
jgi:hypothetical protein